MRRLIVNADTISGDRIHITDKEDISYLSAVLRMKEGEKLLVSDGAGKAWETNIDKISREEIELVVLSEQPVTEELRTRVTLYQGLPKGGKMENVIQKATELGVYRIEPVLTARAISGQEYVTTAKLERWRRVAKEASKQSRRLHVPEIGRVLAFKEALLGLKDAESGEAGYDLVLTMYELEESHTVKQALRESIASARDSNGEPLSIAVFIGPEGGFEREEVDRLAAEGAVSVTMGDTILRTETAGPVAVALILYELNS